MELKELRKQNKLTQEDCAEMFDVSRRTYQAIENKEPNYDTQKYDYFCSILASNLKNESNDDGKFYTAVSTGEGLFDYKMKVISYNRRYLYKYLYDYITKDFGSKVCILYGLRRTGKTTLLFQLLRDLDASLTAYIKVNEKNNMGQLIHDIDILYKKGVRTLMIDEITLLEDFINTAATLSDIYCAKGMKIILSGADSLGFAFAKSDELYDRCFTIHTSYISFEEFSTVLGKNDIDEYIEYGGTMKKENMEYNDANVNLDSVSFREDEATRAYIDTAICRNIQRSLRNDRYGERFAYLRELYENDELTNAINRIVEDINHKFLVSVITERFKSHDLGSSRQMMLKSKATSLKTALYSIDENKVLEGMKRLIEIKEKEELKVPITKEAVAQIKDYLYTLDLIQDVDVRYSDGRVEKRQVFTQPGMRYSISKALVYALKDDEYIKTLSFAEQEYVFNKILSDVKGRMLEDIVLLEKTRNKKDNEIVFKYIAYDIGEYDMVVYNRDTQKYDLYEMKHTKVQDVEKQAKYLMNKELFSSLSKGFGEVHSRNIIYRGDSSNIKGISFESVEHYLKCLRHPY